MNLSPALRGCFAIAESRELLGKQFRLFTAKGVTDPLPEFLYGQKPSWFDNRTLAVEPLWLNPVDKGDSC